MKLTEVIEDPFKEELPPDRVEDYYDRMRRSGIALSADPKHSAAASSMIKHVGKDNREFAQTRRLLVNRIAKSKNKKRIPEYERMIKVFPKDAFEYVKSVLDYERWPEAEPIIMQDVYWACEYARCVIKGCWPEAEPIIIEDSDEAYCYAMEVIKGRWLEAEEVIAQSIWRDAYINFCFENEPIVTKDEVSNLRWKQFNLQGYFAPARLFKISLLDMMMEE